MEGVSLSKLQLDSSAPASITAASLRTALQAHVLAVLAIGDLGRLACTCKALHLLVTTADLATWKTGATAILPRTHPALNYYQACLVTQQFAC